MRKICGSFSPGHPSPVIISFDMPSVVTCDFALRSKLANVLTAPFDFYITPVMMNNHQTIRLRPISSTTNNNSSAQLSKFKNLWLNETDGVEAIADSIQETRVH